MKSKEFIKLIKEQDPTGECHVRLGDGFPFFCERKEGYYDGAYEYIDEDGNYVISTRGSKVDIMGTDLNDFIWDRDGDFSKVICDFERYGDDIQMRKTQEVINKCKKISEDYHRYEKTSSQAFLAMVLDKLRNGWKIYQDKKREIGMYNSMYYKKLLITNRLCQGETSVLLKSGYFQCLKGQWIFSIKKGKKYKGNK